MAKIELVSKPLRSGSVDTDLLLLVILFFSAQLWLLNFTA